MLTVSIMVRFVGKYFNLPLLVFASPLSWDMLDVGTAVGIFYCAVNWVKMRGYEWISARCVSNMTTYTTNHHATERREQQQENTLQLPSPF